MTSEFEVVPAEWKAAINHIVAQRPYLLGVSSA